MDVVLSRSSSDLTGHDLACRSAESVSRSRGPRRDPPCRLRRGAGALRRHRSRRITTPTRPPSTSSASSTAYRPAPCASTAVLDEPGERLWKGDRLAVLPQYRHVGLGGPFVRFAVATAGALGGDRMIAYVQVANVPSSDASAGRPSASRSPYLGDAAPADEHRSP